MQPFNEGFQVENSSDISSILKLDEEHPGLSQTRSLPVYSLTLPWFCYHPSTKHLLRHLNQRHPKAKMIATVDWRRNNGSPCHKVKSIWNFVLAQHFSGLRCKVRKVISPPWASVSIHLL